MGVRARIQSVWADLLSFLQRVQAIGDWLVASAAIAGALAWVTRKPRKQLGVRLASLDAVPSLLQSHAALAEGMEELRATVKKIADRIETELRLNGGASIKDILARMEGRRTAFFDLEADLHFEASPDGLLYWANRSFLRTTGASLHDLKGHGWLNFVAPECAHAEEEWHAAVRESRSFTQEMVLLTAGGGRLRVSATGLPLVLPRDGQTVIGFMVTMRPASLQSGACPAGVENCPAIRERSRDR